MSFEFAHVKTRGDDDNQKDLRGKILTLQCDERAKAQDNCAAMRIIVRGQRWEEACV